MLMIVVRVSRVYVYLQTHQIVCIKYVQLLVCQSYLNKGIFKVYFMFFKNLLE